MEQISDKFVLQNQQVCSFSPLSWSFILRHLFPSVKKEVSFNYIQITLLRPQTMDSIKLLWEEDLGETIPDDKLPRILSLMHKSSIIARHSLIQCKYVYQIYCTKSCLFSTNVLLVSIWVFLFMFGQILYFFLTAVQYFQVNHFDLPLVKSA